MSAGLSDGSGPRRPIYAPGERIALDQPSRTSKAWRMRPRRYRVVFEVQRDGSVRQSYGITARPYYRAIAELLARGGDPDEFFEGVHDGQDRDCPEPSGNRHPDYVAGFRIGRSPQPS